MVPTLKMEKAGGKLVKCRCTLNLVMHLINLLEIVNLASRLPSQF